MHIRRMEAGDLDAVMQIWLKTNKTAHAFIPEEYWESCFGTVKAMLPEAEIYVAEQNRRITGFIGLDNGYVAGIFVLRHMCSQGIGTKLLLTAKNKYSRLHLSVYKKNTGAVRFYEKQDFIITKSQIDNNTGEEEFIMEWKK